MQQGKLHPFRAWTAWLLAIGLCGVPVATSGTDSKVNEAISRGVEFLVSVQAADGAMADRGYRVAMTAWAVMAMAAAGHQPADPTREGEAMGGAIDFILRSAGRWEGYVYFGSGSRGTYEHGMTTLALSEILGLGADKLREPVIRECCQSAIALITATQFSRGSWPYAPRTSPCTVPGDLSISLWPLLALHAASRAGIDVSESTISLAGTFVQDCYGSAADGGFSYVPRVSRGGFAMNASGVRGLQVSNQPNHPGAVATIGWLRANPPSYGQNWFFYGAYYYAQAMEFSGGAAAADAHRVLDRVLLPAQRADGSWLGNSSEVSIGQVYSTSMAILSLAARDQRLSIFQANPKLPGAK